MPQPQDIDWDILATTVRRGLDNEWTAQRFAEEFPDHQRLVYQEILKELYNWFVGRQKAGKDGRWISILTNASIVHKLREKCKFVVGNPPWVRIHNIDDTIRGRLRKKFAFYKMGWTPRLVKTQGRFKEQYDYCMAFVESGLRLLAPDGRLGFVITSKIMQALYAGSMRKTILEQYTILHLKDYSLSGVELFRDATNYPLILIVQKTLPKKILTSVEAVSLGRTKSWKTAQTDLPILKVDPMSPWMMVPPNTIEAIRKMQTRTYSTGFANNPRLGDVYNVVRGVMTSLNEVFLVKELTYSATAGLVVATTEGGQSVVVEEELLRPVVRGENISEDGFNPSGYIIWTHDDKTGEVLPQLPPNAKKHFLSSGIEAKLRKRDGYKKGMPAWIIFRVNKEKLRSKVAWQELDRRIEAIPLPASYKDPRLGKRVQIALQTVYFVVESNEANGAKLVVLLNSIPVRVFICSFAERARGGYFRHISWTVGLIPMPPGFDKIESESGKSSDPVSDAYGLDRDDIKALEEYYEFVYG